MNQYFEWEWRIAQFFRIISSHEFHLNLHKIAFACNDIMDNLLTIFLLFTIQFVCVWRKQVTQFYISPNVTWFTKHSSYCRCYCNACVGISLEFFVHRTFKVVLWNSKVQISFVNNTMYVCDLFVNQQTLYWDGTFVISIMLILQFIYIGIYEYAWTLVINTAISVENWNGKSKWMWLECDFFVQSKKNKKYCS